MTSLINRIGCILVNSSIFSNKISLCSITLVFFCTISFHTHSHPGVFFSNQAILKSGKKITIVPKFDNQNIALPHEALSHVVSYLDPLNGNDFQQIKSLLEAPDVGGNIFLEKFTSLQRQDFRLRNASEIPKEVNLSGLRELIDITTSFAQGQRNSRGMMIRIGREFSNMRFRAARSSSTLQIVYDHDLKRILTLLNSNAAYIYTSERSPIGVESVNGNHQRLQQFIPLRTSFDIQYHALLRPRKITMEEQPNRIQTALPILLPDSDQVAQSLWVPRLRYMRRQTIVVENALLIQPNSHNIGILEISGVPNAFRDFLRNADDIDYELALNWFQKNIQNSLNLLSE